MSNDHHEIEIAKLMYDEFDFYKYHQKERNEQFNND